jgi:hypothetical protein
MACALIWTSPAERGNARVTVKLAAHPNRAPYPAAAASLAAAAEAPPSM